MSTALTSQSVTIRTTRPADEGTLVRLAALDSKRPLSGERLVAEEAGVIRAALALGDGRVVADPFVPTADVVDLLRLRAAVRAPRRASRRPALARLRLA
jgi:hypothetical protein